MRSSWNRGFAGANNWAAEQEPAAAGTLRSEFVFLLNPDTEIVSDCLERLRNAFDANPELGVAGCKLVDPETNVIQHVGGALRPNALSYHIGEGERDRGQYRGLLHCDYVQGAAMAVRRRVWEQLGGLDEAFYPAYFEEADFCRRAHEAGWEVATICDAVVAHHQEPERQVQSWEFLELLFRGRARYLIKHYGPADWLFKYLPAEVKWLASPASARYRRVALRTLWQTWTGTKSD